MQFISIKTVYGDKHLVRVDQLRHERKILTSYRTNNVNTSNGGVHNANIMGLSHPEENPVLNLKLAMKCISTVGKALTESYPLKDCTKTEKIVYELAVVTATNVANNLKFALELVATETGVSHLISKQPYAHQRLMQ